MFPMSHIKSLSLCIKDLEMLKDNIIYSHVLKLVVSCL